MSVSHRNATRVFATLPTMTETSKLFATIGQLTEEDVRADLAWIRQAREKLELEETLLLQVLDLVRSDKTSGAERSLGLTTWAGWRWPATQQAAAPRLVQRPTRPCALVEVSG